MSNTPDLNLAFDVGHSSIGWAVLKAANRETPGLLGCGAVVFPADDCLASERRGFRQQRRHIRATRLRIARMKTLRFWQEIYDRSASMPGQTWLQTASLRGFQSSSTGFNSGQSAGSWMSRTLAGTRASPSQRWKPAPSSMTPAMAAGSSAEILL